MECLRHLWTVAFLALGLAAPAAAGTHVFFTAQESVEKELVRLLDQSQTSIDLALFRFDSRPLAQAVSRAHARGVRIRLILDGHAESQRHPNGQGPLLAAAEVRHLEGRRGGAHGVMHNKFALFDGARAVTGSYNWTPGAEYSNYENMLLTDEAEAVRSYTAEFERLWARATDPAGHGPFAPTHPRRWAPSRSKKKAYRHASQKSVKIRVLRLVPPKM